MRIQPNLVAVGHAAAEKVQLSSTLPLSTELPLCFLLPSFPPLFFYLSLFLSVLAPIHAFLLPLSVCLFLCLPLSCTLCLSRTHAVSPSLSLSSELNDLPFSHFLDRKEIHTLSGVFQKGNSLPQIWFIFQFSSVFLSSVLLCLICFAFVHGDPERAQRKVNIATVAPKLTGGRRCCRAA